MYIYCQNVLLVFLYATIYWVINWGLSFQSFLKHVNQSYVCSFKIGFSLFQNDLKDLDLS